MQREIQNYRDKCIKLTGLLLSGLLFGLFPVHFALDIGGGSIGGVNLSYGDIIVVAIGLVWLVSTYQSRYLPTYFIPIFAFTVVAAVSFMYNSLSPPSYFDEIAFITALLKFLGAVAWMFAIYTLAKEFGTKTVQYGLCLSVCIAVALSINGIYQSIMLDVLRPEGTFNNPNLFGNYLLFNSFIAAYLIYSGKVIKSRVFQALLWVLTIVISAGILTTGSRGTIIGFAAVIGASVLLLLYRGHTSWKMITGIIAGGTVAPIAIIKYNPAIVERILESRNIEIRLSMWEVAFDLFLNNPLLGIGFGQLSQALHEYLGLNIDPHNTYILIATEAGIVGAAVFFGLVILIIRDGIEQSRQSLYVVFIVAGFIGILVQGTVTDVDNFRTLWITAGLIGAHKAAIASHPERSFTTTAQTFRERLPTTTKLS